MEKAERILGYEIDGKLDKVCVKFMYRQFNLQQFYILPLQYICVFCTDLRTNSDYFPIQH